MPKEVKWMILGDFNLIRAQENRNKPGGSIEEMFMFNDAISVQGLTKIPLQGKNTHGLTCKLLPCWKS